MGSHWDSVIDSGFAKGELLDTHLTQGELRELLSHLIDERPEDIPSLLSIAGEPPATLSPYQTNLVCLMYRFALKQWERVEHLKRMNASLREQIQLHPGPTSASSMMMSEVVDLLTTTMTCLGSTMAEMGKALDKLDKSVSKDGKHRKVKLTRKGGKPETVDLGVPDAILDSIEDDTERIVSAVFGTTPEVEDE